MRQPKPYWRKQKQCWNVQINGRQISLGRDKKEAWRRYHELMAKNEPLHDSTTIETLFERYLDWVEENRKPATYEKIRHNLSAFANFMGKQKAINTLSGSNLADWVESEHTWGDTTRNEGIGCVIRAFNWAVGKRYIQTNNVAQVPDKPRRKRRETTLSQEDWKRMRELVKDQEFGDLLDFMWETGCRPVEARTMEARHIDLASGLVVFPASEAKGEREPRVIYLNNASLAICKRLVTKHPKGVIMRNICGRSWTKDAIKCRFTRLSQKLGTRVFAYALRHSFATNGLKSGTDAIVLSELMGHRDTTMISKTYSHLAKDASFLKQAAERLSSKRT